MMLKPWERKILVFVPLMALLLLSNHILASADINGVVTSPDGTPITANILVFEENIETSSYQTGEDGVFSIELPTGQYSLLVYANDPETRGFDYVPAALDVDGDFDDEISLGFGSSLVFIGDFQFIDTENLPLKTTYLVQDESGVVLVPNGFPLRFSDKRGVDYAIPILSPKEIILPSNKVVGLNVTSLILVETEINERGFIIPDFKAADTGEVKYIDIRKYTIPISRVLADDSFEELNSRLMEMDQYGFYLAKQETALNNGIKYIEDSESLYDLEEYDESFGALKRGYLAFTHTNNELLNMYRDARFSVYLLVAFLAVASLVTGYLLVDGFIRQALVDIAILASSLVFFYYTYPGSRTIPFTNFVLASAGFLAAFLGVGLVFPRFFTGGSSDGRVHTRNLLSPIFNIAKRSLRRRKFRFMLTFISITLLVMSFVTLTSFSEGYGLITGESTPKSGWAGVYIREGTWSLEEPSFILLDETENNWIISQPEVDHISSKAENVPSRSPLLQVGEQPIFGVIGVSENELSFIDLDTILVTGELPGEMGVSISESLSGTIGLSLGDSLIIGAQEYLVSGIFDDEAFIGLNDLDGTPYAPNKWVNISPEGETPNWVLREATPNEVLILSTWQSMRLSTVGIQRIAIDINPEYNATGFAERLALERGYLSWANTATAYYSYRLGNYFQGKGATLFIPWIIVVLNVIVTMLNSLYERRKEIEILSSVGLNPAQVSSIFVAEAAITGFIAGGLGYLIGLGFYKMLAILNIGLQVHQKVSAVWGLAAIGLAISAVVTGAFAALQNSVVITPSLMRRWRLERISSGFQEPWRVDIPIKLDSAEVSSYLDFIEAHLHTLKDHPTHVTSSIKRYDDRLDFVYKSYQATTGNFYTKNSLVIGPHENGDFKAVLESYGENEWVRYAGSLIRRITMDYSTEKVA